MAEENGFRVKLYVYDLTKGLARTMSMALLGKQIDGVWHTGTVVYGEEYYFGGTGGIESCPPCGTILGQPDTIVDLGITHVPKEMFLEYLSQLAISSFRPEDYNLFQHNCNNFSDEVSQFLIGKNIPPHITNLPAEVLSTPLGAMMKPLIDSMNVNPSGGHSVFPTSSPSQPASQGSSQLPSQTSSQAASPKPSLQTPTQSSPAVQKPVTLTADIDVSTMKSDEIQGNIQSCFSMVELNLWNETLEYLQTPNPSWSLSKTHLHMLGKILSSKPGTIKMVVWTSTCMILQNLLLNTDFLPIIVHTSDNTLGEILSQYSSVSLEHKQYLIKLIINLCSSKQGCSVLFGNNKHILLCEQCLQICCNGLLEKQSEEFLFLSSNLALNISLAQINEDVEVEVGSALTTSLKSPVQDKTAVNLLSSLINIMSRNNQMKCLVRVMGCEWPHLKQLSQQTQTLYNKVKLLSEP